MKNIVLIIILGLIAGCSGGSYIESKDNKEIIIAIYPTGTTSETYYFSLNANSEFIAEKGTRVENDITHIPFFKYIDKSEKIFLSSSEFSNIIDLVNKAYECDLGINESIVDDSWDVQILYKNKIIKQNYWFDIPPQIKDLVDTFINVSPIEVDLHGWA